MKSFRLRKERDNVVTTRILKKHRIECPRIEFPSDKRLMSKKFNS